MVVLFSALGVIAVAGISVGVYQLSRNSGEDIDVMRDFKIAKKALSEFHKENINKCDDIKQLKKYIDKELQFDFRRYAIAENERFFVVHRASKLDYEEFIDKAGGRSYFEEGDLYLSFLKFKVSEVEPVAMVKMFPSKDIRTTTSIEWSVEESVTEGNEIKSVEWENMHDVYLEPGQQVVKCRVQDRNENWSEWTTIEFDVKEIKGTKNIEAGENFLMIVHNNGKVEGFGKNRFGQMGNGALDELKERTYIPGIENVESFACGESHAVFTNYRGQVFSMGSNDFGQLGIGSRLNAKAAQKIWGLEKVKQIEAGRDFSAAVLPTGAVLTWGQNDCGQLGAEKPLYQEIPKRVSGITNVRQVSLGHNHMLCLMYDGTVVAWGDNSHGQIGSGYKGKTTEPTVVEIKHVKQVVAGKYFSLALLENGKIFGWGYNHVGQLGMTSEPDVVFPREIPKIKNIVKLAAKESFVLAMNEIGDIYTWGRYLHTDDEGFMEPQHIAGVKYVKDIAASYADAFALMENDEIITWSSNIDMHVNLDQTVFHEQAPIDEE